MTYLGKESEKVYIYIYVYMYLYQLNYFALHMKLTQPFRSAIIQYKIEKLKYIKTEKN